MANFYFKSEFWKNYAVIRYTSPVEPHIEKGFSEDQMDTKRSDIIWNLTLKNKTT